MADVTGVTTEPHDESTGDFVEIQTLDVRTHTYLDIGAMTHPGCVRTNNEDSFVVARLARTLSVDVGSAPADGIARVAQDVDRLLIVADGMGGVEGGERASELAVATLESVILNGPIGSLPNDESSDDRIKAELKSAFEHIDRVVYNEASTDPVRQGMGTTVTLAFGTGKTFFIAHAGDSRAYLLRSGKLSQVTNDHTLVQMMVTGGLLAPELARTHQRRNVVTNVVGGPSEGVSVEIHKLKLEHDDTLLLCSDGLTEVVDDPAISEILNREANPRIAAEALVRAALAQGGPDNITVVVARVQVGF